MSLEVVSLIVNSLISVLSIVITAVIANALIKYRVDQLEKKVEKHNGIIERVFKLEQKVEDLS